VCTLEILTFSGERSLGDGFVRTSVKCRKVQRERNGILQGNEIVQQNYSCQSLVYNADFDVLSGAFNMKISLLSKNV